MYIQYAMIAFAFVVLAIEYIRTQTNLKQSIFILLDLCVIYFVGEPDFWSVVLLLILLVDSVVERRKEFYEKQGNTQA